MDVTATDHVVSAGRCEGTGSATSRQATSPPSVICRVEGDVIGGHSDHQSTPRRSAATSSSALRTSTTSRQATSPAAAAAAGVIISPPSVGSSVLPMKLAERQRPKSASTSPTIQQPTCSPSLTPSTSSTTARTSSAAGLQALKNGGTTSTKSSSVQSRTSPVDEKLRTSRITAPRMDSCTPHNSAVASRSAPFMDSYSSRNSVTVAHSVTAAVSNATPAPAQPDRQIIYF